MLCTAAHAAQRISFLNAIARTALALRSPPCAGHAVVLVAVVVVSAQDRIEKRPHFTCNRIEAGLERLAERGDCGARLGRPPEWPSAQSAKAVRRSLK